MKQKLLAALEQRYGGALGSKNEIYEKVVTAYGNLITSEEQIPDIVAGVEPLLKQFQSVNDKLRAFENKPKPEPTPKPSDNGNQPPETKSEPKPQEEVPAWAKLLLEQNQALAEQNKTFAEKLTAFESAKTAEQAVKQAQEKFGADEWVNGYPELRDSAWAQAMRIYDRTGKSMTADELHTEAMEIFKPLAKAKGLDISQPFKSDGGAGTSEAEKNKAFADEIRNALGMNKGE